MYRSADSELRELLERLHDTYNRPEFIPDDPISVPHRFTDRAARELAGFFAATIAWGNRRTIVRNGHRMMRLMDDAPADFVRNASERELAGLDAFVHRTFRGCDLRDFVLALRRIDSGWGGLGAFFEHSYAVTGDRPAIERDPVSPLLAALKCAADDVTGTDTTVGFFTGYTDTAVIAGKTGNRSCMSYGPGSLALAHKPNEYVPHADIVRCQSVLIALADNTLWGADGQVGA